jgi:hypothetical protein
MGLKKDLLIMILILVISLGIVGGPYYYNNDKFGPKKGDKINFSIMVISLILFFGMFFGAFKMKDKLKDNKKLFIPIIIFFVCIVGLFLYGYSNISKEVDKNIKGTEKNVEDVAEDVEEMSGVMKINLVITVLFLIAIVFSLYIKKYKWAGISFGAGGFIISLVNIVNYFIENSDNYEDSGAGRWSVFMAILTLISPILFKFGGPLKGKKEIFMFSGSLLISYLIWTIGISPTVSNIYDDPKQYILFGDYVRRILDSSYSRLEDMGAAQKNRFYFRTLLLAIFYFVTPIFILKKIKKINLLPAFYPVWLFVLFPLISTFFSHDCVQDLEPEEGYDLYYTLDNILKLHTFHKVDEEVE